MSTEDTGTEATPATSHHHRLRDHFALDKLKKLGALGVIVLILHLLFHVVELLIIPAIIWLFAHK